MAKHFQSPLSPHPQWHVVGWTRGLLSLPNGPKEVVPGWTLEAAEEAGRSKNDVLVLMHLPPFAESDTKPEMPWFCISGVVYARTIDEAKAIAREEMSKVISVLSLVFRRSFDGVAAITIQGQFTRSGTGKFQAKVSQEIGPSYGTVSPIEPHRFSEVRELWSALDSCPSPKLKSCLDRSLGWFRKAAFDTDPRTRLLFCWTAVEALTYAIPSTKGKTPALCHMCKRGLKCANCGKEAVKAGGDGPITLKEILIDRYGLVGRREYDDLRQLRNRLVHGSDDPSSPNAQIDSTVDKFVDVVSNLIRKVVSDPI